MIQSISKIVGVTVIAAALCACVTTQPRAINSVAFEAASVRSILVVPVINESVEVEADKFMLSTLPIPLAERGYYVFPVNTVKHILEQEGFYEGQQIHNQTAPTLANLFDADAVLFVTIKNWTTRYVIISAATEVDIEYRLVSKDGVEIWSAQRKQIYQPPNSGGGLLGALINAAMAKAAPNYIPLANMANRDAFLIGESAIPTGPYYIRPKQ